VPLRKEAHFATKGNRSELEAPAALLERLEAVDDRREDPRALVAAIARMSEAYTVDRDALTTVGRSASGRRARLRFFLPRDLPKATRPMLELAARGSIPKGAELRLLDLGAGLGTTTLSVARALSLAGDERALSVLGVDDDPRALEVFERVVARPIEGFAPIRLETRVGRLPAALDELGGVFDLITIGLALNEVPDPRELVERARARLAPDGIMLILEPALREATRALMRLRDAIAEEGALAILGPCPHASPCPMLPRERDWCHDAADAPLPPPLDAWAREAGLRDDRPTFAWLALKNGARPSERYHRVVSHRLPSKGKLELAVCTPRGELKRARRLDRHAGEANEAFASASRGDRLAIEGSTRGDALVVGVDDEVRRL
jgi:SAM-dependent methyltransferase